MGAEELGRGVGGGGVEGELIFDRQAGALMDFAERTDAILK